ncbi:MAG: PIN domain-containing protein [Deltaproteobacteria bacterium]|nr:PIN domain-containing protein [Deltaproteobacteria bacterium]
MIAVDTSVVVAAFATWHESHASAVRVLEQNPSLPAHCALEAYSVLTRLPAPHRAEATLVAEFLRLSFPRPWLTLSASRQARLLASLAAAHVCGGSSYDGLVAATVAASGAKLISCDQRARRVYERLGLEFEILSTMPSR